MVVAVSAFASAQQPNLADTNVYSTYPFGGDDEGGTKNWYSIYWFQHRNWRAMGLVEPMPEQLPASRDTNGHWGAPADNLQLSVRFHRREFIPGEPVHVMVVLRNLVPSSRRVEHRATGKSQARKNFAFVLRNGTNALNWSWTDPKLPDPLPDGFQLPKDFYVHTMEAHSQMAFFVRLDEIFDLGQPGEYSVQVTWPERTPGGRTIITNVVSGTATFQIVERLSPAEIAAANAFARHLKEVQQKYAAGYNKFMEHFLATNKPASERSRGMTNQPSAK